MVKKITYVSRTTIPSRSANSIHVMKMCDALSQEGYKISLLTDPIIAKKMDSNEPEIIDDYKYYGARHHFKIIKLYYPWIKKVNGIIYSIYSFFWIKRRKTDLVFSRDLLTAFLCATYDYKVIYECHGISDSYFDIYILNKLIKYKKLNMFISISNEMYKILLHRYPEIININHLTAHDGVDLNQFGESVKKYEIRENLKYTKKDFVIGYTGSLMNGRGIELIIDLAEKLQDYKFFVAGGREFEIEYYNEYKKRERINNIFFNGFIPNGKIVKYLSACDLLLMPYQKNLTSASGIKINNTKWMSPMKMFEYMASGVPIVSSYFRVLEEVLHHNHNAYFVDPENIDEWIHAIKQLHSDIKLRKKLSENARHDVTNYTWLNRAQRIIYNLK